MQNLVGTPVLARVECKGRKQVPPPVNDKYQGPKNIKEGKLRRLKVHLGDDAMSMLKLGLLHAFGQVLLQKLWAIALQVGWDVVDHVKGYTAVIRHPIHRYLVFNLEVRILLLVVAFALQLLGRHNDYIFDPMQVLLDREERSVTTFLVRRQLNHHPNGW